MEKEEREKIARKNKEVWCREIEFWKKENPFIFRKVRYDTDVLKMTYYEFKELIRKLKLAQGDL